MGSPLGVTFANYYMVNLENKIFRDRPELKPKVYCRYIDDCFLLLENTDQLHPLIQAFKSNSVLNFTYELGTERKLNFLDVSVHLPPATSVTGLDTTNIQRTTLPVITTPDTPLHSTTEQSLKFQTEVYTKPTDTGVYLNAKSECPQRYKTGTIKALIIRTYKISSDWSIFHRSIQNLKQALINNGYSNRDFDRVLNSYINPTRRQPAPPNISDENTHEIFYKNQFSEAYKIDERIMKEIVHSNVKCKNQSDKLKLTIYYKSSQVSQFLSRNNSQPEKPDIQKTNLIYEYKCNIGECEHQLNSYIGSTVTTLSRRLTMHLSNGAPKKHSQQKHQEALNRETIVKNTKIIRTENDANRLHILESLYIQKYRPNLNLQCTGNVRTLKLYHNAQHSLNISRPDRHASQSPPVTRSQQSGNLQS